MLNSETSAETGFSPFLYTFGTLDVPYFSLPERPIAVHGEFLKMLDEDLMRVRAAAQLVQQQQQSKRVLHGAINAYAIGDFVLFDEASKGFRDQKLKLRYSGPYIVVSVHKADVTCKHIVTAKEKVFHMDDLKPFIGSLPAAYSAAQCDDDQYIIEGIIDYYGDPLRRSSMEFLVLFEGNDEVWVRYNIDLAASSPFQQYVKSQPELEPLTVTSETWRQMNADYNRLGIQGVAPGTTCLVNLKSWGDEYYRSLELPVGIIYVVLCNYVRWTSPNRKKIDLFCPLFNQSFVWNAVATRMYGMCSVLGPNMMLVSSRFCDLNPRIRA